MILSMKKYLNLALRQGLNQKKSQNNLNPLGHQFELLQVYDQIAQYFMMEMDLLTITIKLQIIKSNNSVTIVFKLINFFKILYVLI